MQLPSTVTAAASSTHAHLAMRAPVQRRHFGAFTAAFATAAGAVAPIAATAATAVPSAPSARSDRATGSPRGNSNATPSSSSRALRIVHASDLHFLERPTLSDVLSGPKRVIGLLHLFALGRASKFSRSVQEQLVDTIAHMQPQPDLLLLSGDLTTLSLESEFRAARLALHPLLDNDGAFPTLIVPGNHDAYTRGAVQQRLMHRYFGPWMRRLLPKPPEAEKGGLDAQVEPWQWSTSANPERFRAQVERVQRHFAQFDSPAASSSPGSEPFSAVPVFSLGFLRLLCLDPCRPTGIGSRGEYPRQQHEQLERLLHDAPIPHADATAPWRLAQSSGASPSPLAPPLPLPSSYNVLVSHYPLLDGRGSGRAYERPWPWQANFWHGAHNSDELRRIFLQPENKARPQMYLHGHVHHGYTDRMPLSADGEQVLHSFDPGSGGQSFSAEKKRCAAFNVYTITQLQTHEEAGGDSNSVKDVPAAASSNALVFEQPSSDGRVRYRVEVERWLHDGKQFQKESKPYTEGF
jgi:hypothetical protein